MKAVKKAPCWVVRDADGKPWDEEWDAHESTREAAQTSIEELREEREDADGVTLTPEEEADLIVAGKPAGPDRDRLHARALASARREAARLASLHPVQLPAACYTVTCDHDGCTAAPEDMDGHDCLHFTGDAPFVAVDYDWREVGGLHFCDDHEGEHTCATCGGLLGDGADLEDRVCAGCLAAPGPADVAFPELETP